MSRDEQFSYIFLLVFSIIFLIWVVPNQIIAGENASVSPRLLPQILAGGIGSIAAIQIVRSVLFPSVLRPEFIIKRRSYVTVFLMVVVLAATGAIINAVPTIYVNGIAVGRFWLGAVVMVPVLLFISGVRSWWQIPLYTILLIVIVFFLTQITGIYIQ